MGGSKDFDPILELQTEVGNGYGSLTWTDF